MKLYHNPRCSKSRKAKELLPESTEIIEYLKTPLSIEELREVCTLLAMNPKDLLRKSEDEYNMLLQKHGVPNSEEALVWMHEHPKLMQRPIFVNKNKAIIGRPPENVLKILKASSFS